MINDDSRDPDEKWWIKDLQLYESDYNVLISGKELTGGIINAAHKLLAQQFPRIKGFQSTIHCHHLYFTSVSDTIKSVQILHTGRYCLFISLVDLIMHISIAGESHHWICTSCYGDGIVYVMDSLGSFMALNRTTVLQIAKIYSVPPSRRHL